MIHAKDALLLSSAQLSDEEKVSAGKLEAEIEVAVNSRMERRGLHDFFTGEKNANVIAEVNVRLKSAGYFTDWKPDIQRGQFSNNPVHAGWQLTLIPTQESYEAAVSLVAN